VANLVQLKEQMDIVSHNREAWDRQVAEGNRWTLPVGPDEIAAARRGDWSIVLTASKPVPRDWFPPLQGCRVLCLASGGGQQAPVLAAAGAIVTTLDNSPRQLQQDRLVAQREGLLIETVQGDMADLSAFPDGAFDLVFHPVANVFAPAVRPVWREAFRVLRSGGVLLAGFMNPDRYIFDNDAIEQRGQLKVRHRLPYSDAESLAESERARLMREGWPLEFSHTLEDQIGGQCDAGFIIVGFYEDYYPPDSEDLPSKYMPAFFATRAIKP
jgi:SAM-dependent methyltransferase